jgi:flagellar assembly factor FliW
VGIPHLRRFALIQDPVRPEIVWLQSTRDPAWAFALVSPRLINAEYQVRATAEQLQALQVTDYSEVEVYVALNRTATSVTANLQAPILIHRRRTLGMQLVLSDSRFSVRQSVGVGAELRRSA